MTSSERQAIEEYERRQTLLEPFRRITAEWAVETEHRFQRRIRDLDLVASGDLESDWNVSVIARETGVVVAQFGFDSSGRYHDMRRVQYDTPRPDDAYESWVKSKIEKGQIRYSKLAQRLGVSLSDPRVINDLKYRFAKSTNVSLKRRRWYNKGKEASVNELYDQLSEAMQAVAVSNIKRVTTTPVTS